MKQFSLTVFFVIGLLKMLTAQNPDGFFQECEKYVQKTIPFILDKNLDSLLKSNKIYLLDTRTLSEYEVSHIKNAKWIGFRTFNLDSIKEMPKNAFIVTYCSIGYRSEKIGEKLRQNGYLNVYNLKGGVFNWINNQYKVYSNNKQTTNIHGYNQNWIKWLNKSVCNPVIK